MFENSNEIHELNVMLMLLMMINTGIERDIRADTWMEEYIEVICNSL